MNVENIQKVIDHLKSLPPERFDMSVWACTSDLEEDIPTDMLNHDCETVGCIAGWAVAVLAPTCGSTDPMERAIVLFGLTYDQGQQLFINQKYIRRSATRDDAILTLEKLIATGSVDWSHVS